MRVSTPPIDEDTADGKPRGFFTSLTPPESNTDITPSPTSSSPRLGPSVHHHRCQRISLSAQPREWWDPMPAPRIRRQQTPAPQDFTFDVPEHLPSSPLCPANSRHESGGTGLCVYHGRRRVKSTLRDESTRDTRPSLTGGLY